VSDEEIASFTKIIDSILEISDLETISAKKVRKAIQAAVDRDLTPQKVVRLALIENPG
jgi:upstream activation factor subunit UAF30